MAITYDTFSDGDNNGGTGSLTWNHTCTGLNVILFIGIAGDVQAGSDDISSVTFDGNACTFIAKIGDATTSRWTYLYYKIVGTGSGTGKAIVVSSTSNHYLQACATSYTGAAQTAQPDSSATLSAVVNGLTVSTTVVASNCWLVLVGNKPFNGDPLSAGTGTTYRGTTASFNGANLFDSNGTVSTGSQSLQMMNNATDAISGVIASFSEASGDGANPHNSLSLLGVG